MANVINLQQSSIFFANDQQKTQNYSDRRFTLLLKESLLPRVAPFVVPLGINFRED